MPENLELPRVADEDRGIGPVVAVSDVGPKDNTGCGHDPQSDAVRVAHVLALCDVAARVRRGAGLVEQGELDRGADVLHDEDVEGRSFLGQIPPEFGAEEQRVGALVAALGEGTQAAESAERGRRAVRVFRDPVCDHLVAERLLRRIGNRAAIHAQLLLQRRRVRFSLAGDDRIRAQHVERPSTAFPVFAPNARQPRGARVPRAIELEAALEKRGGHSAAVIFRIPYLEQTKVVLGRVHAALAVALDRRLADGAVAEIEDERSGNEVEVAHAERPAVDVSREDDAVDVRGRARDVHRTSHEAYARADAGQAVRVGKERVAEVLRKLVPAPVGNDRILRNRFRGNDYGGDRQDRTHGEHEPLREAPHPTDSRCTGNKDRWHLVRLLAETLFVLSDAVFRAVAIGRRRPEPEAAYDNKEARDPPTPRAQWLFSANYQFTTNLLTWKKQLSADFADELFGLNDCLAHPFLQSAEICVICGCNRRF